MKTIIVPLDFSQESMAGLDMALMLANRTGAHIKMVHVINGNESESGNINEIRQAVKMKFEYIITNYSKEKILKNNLSYAIREGKVFREITNLAESAGETVVVLSTYGNSGFDELFMGGDAYKIVSHSKFPVITVRRSTIPNGINKIVLPLDITFETREKVPYTAHLAQLFNSEIHILQVQLSNSGNLQRKLRKYTRQIGDYLKNKNISFYMEEARGDNITDLTLKYAVKINADLISIMTEQEESFANLLLGSFAHQMINQSFIPVLCFPNYQLSVNGGSFWNEGKSYG